MFIQIIKKWGSIKNLSCEILKNAYTQYSDPGKSHVQIIIFYITAMFREQINISSGHSAFAVLKIILVIMLSASHSCFSLFFQISIHVCSNIPF